MRLVRGTPSRMACVLVLATMGVALPAYARFSGSADAAVHQTRPAAFKVVKINNFKFMPATITVTVGTAVVWVNQQTGVTHTVTADDGSFNSGLLGPGKFFAHKFTATGTVTYHCMIHPFMKAKVVVQ